MTGQAICGRISVLLICLFIWFLILKFTFVRDHFPGFITLFHVHSIWISNKHFRSLKIPKSRCSEFFIESHLLESASFNMMHSCYINHFICNHWFHNWIIQGDALILSFKFKVIPFNFSTVKTSLGRMIWHIWYEDSIIWEVFDSQTMTFQLHTIYCITLQANF